jgi:chromatin remodeling complex protein RSC6
MSAAVKSTKKAATKTETVATTPVVAAVAVPAATASKTPAKKNDKATTVAAVAPVVAAVPAATATTEVHEEDISATLQKSIADLHEQLTNLKAAASAAANALKTIEKQAARVIKKADRRKKRKVETTEGGEPKVSTCIFTKPVKVTDELCAFLGKPKGTEVSRSAVTKGVLAYAKSHSLMDKQAIKADAALRKLLTLNEGQDLTILNLQKFLRRHYVKAIPAAV